MKRKWQFGTLVLATSVLWYGCGHTQAARVEAARAKQELQDAQETNVVRFVRSPDAAPAFQLNDLDGKPLSLGDARGKIVLLNFWATWCGPCRAEIPDLVDLQKRYSDKLEIIALATDEDDAGRPRLKAG